MTSVCAGVIPIFNIAATVCPPPPLIAIDVVLVSVIGIVDDVLAALAFVELLELLEPQPAAASAAPASGRIR